MSMHFQLIVVLYLIFSDALTLPLYFAMSENGQTHGKNLAAI